MRVFCITTLEGLGRRTHYREQKLRTSLPQGDPPHRSWRSQFLDWLMAAEMRMGFKFDFFYQYPLLKDAIILNTDYETVELLINKQIALSGQRLERLPAARESMIQKGVPVPFSHN